MLEPKFIRVDANEAPRGEDEDPEHVETQHLWQCRQHDAAREEKGGKGRVKGRRQMEAEAMEVPI